MIGLSFGPNRRDALEHVGDDLDLLQVVLVVRVLGTPSDAHAIARAGAHRVVAR
jgi:hypothetical protein